MYRTKDETEYGTLRQGDIIRGIHCLGAINLNTIIYGAPNTATDTRKDALSWTVNNPPSIADVMVLSHSCEISLDNKIKLTSILLAPIRNAHNATAPHMLKTLIDSNIIEDGLEGSFYKYFYLTPHAGLEHKDGAIVDFSKSFSVRNKSYNELASNKIIQLTDMIVDKMALKLSLYYYRTQKSTAQAS